MEEFLLQATLQNTMMSRHFDRNPNDGELFKKILNSQQIYFHALVKIKMNRNTIWKRVTNDHFKVFSM